MIITRSFPKARIPASSEMRRGYLQFVIDPLVLKFNKDIAAQRDQVKQLIEARAKEGRESFARRVRGGVQIVGCGCGRAL